MNAYEESVLQLDDVRKENKLLSNEIKDIMDQISEGGRSIHEIDKIRKRLEAEKMELQAALEEAEGALEQEENKVLRSQLELSQVRQEIERRIAEKDEEFQSTRKNFTKAVDGMQTALEQESKGKAEALRMKKKLEADVSELETALEHANAANGETQKTIKKYHGSIRDAQAKLEDEQRAKEVTRDGLLGNERKANTTQNALEEARTLLEQRGSSSLRCKHCMAIWTRCPVRLLSLRRRPRRQWLMLPALLRNSVLNKTWLLDSRGNANSLNAKSRTAPPGWTMPRPTPSREARRP